MATGATPGSGRPLSLIQRGQIADDKYLGMMGSRKIGGHEYPARAVDRSAQFCAQRRGRHSRRPQHDRGRNLLAPTQTEPGSILLTLAEAAATITRPRGENRASTRAPER